MTQVFIVLETINEGDHDEAEVFAGVYASQRDAENAISLENARRRECARRDGKFVVIEQVLGQPIIRC